MARVAERQRIIARVIELMGVTRARAIEALGTLRPTFAMSVKRCTDEDPPPGKGRARVCLDSS